ncbi:3-oxo-5-alpha-steroid 4-dehydrogenase [Pleosporales sp. CAS-2024a]
MSRPRPPDAGDWARAAVAMRAFYLASSLLMLALQCVPPLRRRFVVYGARTTPAARRQPVSSHRRLPQPPQPPPPPLAALLDRLAAVQVPHRYFTHFYLASVASALFWGLWLRVWHAPAPRLAAWLLMLLQGLRRLLESHVYTATSTSTMWFAHWLLGLLFYLCINMSIWVDGLPAPPRRGALAVLVPAVLTAQALQHSCHAYLYRLRTENKGYQLPSHPLFPTLLCPHYTCEIAIYALLSLIAAPEGRLVSWTMVCATIFVASNLAVTAWGTKQWYADRFGAATLSHRKRIIPCIW